MILVLANTMVVILLQDMSVVLNQHVIHIKLTH